MTQSVWTPERTRTLRQWTVFAASYPDFCINQSEMHRPEGIFCTRPDQDVATDRALSARELHEELLGLSDANLEARWKSLLAEQAAEREAQHPLNRHVANAATYDFYSKAAYWTLQEACALLLERNPRQWDLKTVKPHAQISTTASQYMDLHDLASRAVAMGQLCRTNLPGFFLAWAKRNRLAIPAALMDAVESHGIQVADWKTMYDLQVELTNALEARIAQLEAHPPEPAPIAAPKPQAAMTRERNTLLKLVLGLAMDCYGYRPQAPRSSTAGEIASALELKGISISEDTVRKYLANAAEFAPPADT